MTTVMVFGTFDIIHAGHLHLFKQAKKHGDKLVVAVARDVNVKKIKKAKSLHIEKERLEMLSHLNLVDKVILGHKTNPYEPVIRIKPDVIALGYDQKEYVEKLSEFLATAGLKCKIVRLPPYQEERLKTSKIRKYFEKVV